MPEWYVSDNGQESGPLTLDDIRHLLSQGGFTNQALIWREGMAEWALIGSLMLIPLQPRQNYAPPANRVRKATSKRAGAIARYKHRVGTRSFIFQVILIGWTAMMAAWICSFSISATGRSDVRGSPDERDDAAAELGAGWCCLGGVWALVAFPCGIAAIATLERKE